MHLLKGMHQISRSQIKDTLFLSIYGYPIRVPLYPGKNQMILFVGQGDFCSSTFECNIQSLNLFMRPSAFLRRTTTPLAVTTGHCCPVACTLTPCGHLPPFLIGTHTMLRELPLALIYFRGPIRNVLEALSTMGSYVSGPAQCRGHHAL